MLLFDFNILLISESIWIVDYSKHLTKPYSGLLQFIAVIRYLKHFRWLSTQMHLKIFHGGFSQKNILIGTDMWNGFLKLRRKESLWKMV